MKLKKTLIFTATTTTLASLALATAATSTTVEGTVTGKVMFKGERPTPKVLTIGDEASKGCCPDGVDMDATDRSLLISEDGGLANAVIEIEIDGMDAKVAEEPYVIDQTKCRFEPHVVVVPVGGTVSYKNSDEVSHNIHTYATKNEGKNQTVAAAGDMTQKLDKAEQVKVTCDIHPWMTGWVYVTKASVWATSAADGSFSIAGLPPGEYNLKVWHETLGKGKGKAVVGEDGTSEAIVIEMGAAKKKKGRGRR